MLQISVNKLNSGILNIVANKVHITGFTREEMLQRFLDTGVEAWSMKGLYDFQKLDFHNIKDNALIIVLKDGKEIDRYQYKPIYKNRIELVNEKGNKVSRIFVIRKSTFSTHYHFKIIVDKESDLFQEKDQSVLFQNKEELNQYLLHKYAASFSYQSF